MEHKNWFLRHKIITGFLAFFVLIIIIAIISGPSEKQSNKESNKNEVIKEEPKIEESINKENKVEESSKIWHKITTFNGISDKNTDTFTIKGDKFKLIYKVIPENEYSVFSLYVYKESNKFPLDTIDLDSGKDSTIIYDGPGEYYLKIIAANLMSWEVEVEDYY